MATSSEEEKSEVVLLAGYHHVTLLKTFLMPLTYLRSSVTSEKPSLCAVLFCRAIRLLIPVVSLFFIGLQIVLDNFFLHDFVLESKKKGVPL